MLPQKSGAARRRSIGGLYVSSICASLPLDWLGFLLIIQTSAVLLDLAFYMLYEHESFGQSSSMLLYRLMYEL